MKLKTCLLCLLLAAVTLAGCQTTPTVSDTWRPKIYTAKPSEAGVWRGQDGELIKCSKPYFNNLVCLPKRDLKTIYKHCLEAGAVW